MLQQAENKITRLMGTVVNIRKGQSKEFRKELGKWCALIPLSRICSWPALIAV